MSKLSSTGKVKRQKGLSIATVLRVYGSVYYNNIVFELDELGIGPKSWISTLLRHLEAKSSVAAADDEPVRNMRTVIELLAGNTEANRLLNQPAKRTSAAHIRRLFQISEQLVASADTPTLARGRSALRTFFFAQAHIASFAEPIDRQRVRFKPALSTPKSDPRPLISDLSDIADPRANLPVGALAATTAKEVATAIKERTEYDLGRIRAACIADMTAGAALRKRAKELRGLHVPSSQLSVIREGMRNSRSAKFYFTRVGITAEIALRGVLRIIHTEKLATSRGTVDRYDIPLVRELRSIFLDGTAVFKSQRLFEIEHRASVEELFAAFHLLHTHVGWNWSSVSSLKADEIDLSTPGLVVLQSFKSKTDDDTPVRSIDLSEPGVQMAIEILLWNREQLLKCGFLAPSEHRLWSTRPRLGSKQREGYFHPVLRLQDFIQRHDLPKYSLEQVRNQALFRVSLTQGGIEAARLQGGHKSYGTTQRYVGNIVQDRISSALNLEFSQRLEKEILYIHGGGRRDSPEIALLKPIGDGASCVDPGAPPPGRSRKSGSCSAESCHADGGCANRRIAIDDRRVEEVLRLNRHYKESWQRLMQANSERFVVHTLPRMSFNAALLLALQRGPYSARVAHISSNIGIP